MQFTSRSVATLALGAFALTACSGSDGAGVDPGVTPEVTDSAATAREMAIAYQEPALPLTPEDATVVWDSPAGVVLAQPDGGTFRRVDVGIDGNDSNGDASGAMLSASEEYIVYASSSTNLVADDANGFIDIFLEWYKASGPLIVNRSATGEQADADATLPWINGNGSFVTYSSTATNLVDNDDKEAHDAFLYDVASQTTELLSVATDGTPGNSNSWDARTTTDGNLVVFSSSADNLVDGDTNDSVDVFLRDRAAGTTIRLSVAPDGSQHEGHSLAPTINSDGRYIAYMSEGKDIVGDATGTAQQIYLYEVETGITMRVSNSINGGEPDSNALNPEFNFNGNMLVFESDASDLVEGDNNGEADVFLFRFDTGVTSVLSVNVDGETARGQSVSPRITGGGRFVTFISNAIDLDVAGQYKPPGVFVYDTVDDSLVQVN